jgi:hypothetical protein
MVEHRGEVAHKSNFAFHPMPRLAAHSMHHEISDLESSVAHGLRHEEALDGDRPAILLQPIERHVASTLKGRLLAIASGVALDA